MMNEESLGRPIGRITAILGCWHKGLSRPFHDGDVSYRVCLECGARRKFDTETFQTTGRYYAPVSVEAGDVNTFPVGAAVAYGLAIAAGVIGVVYAAWVLG